MSFLEVAKRNAARGFKVVPLTDPKGKGCFLKNWPELATDDLAQIEEWARQYPDANCGVVTTETLMILESDFYPDLEKLLGAPVPRTFTVQCRENRPHFYFYQTDKSRAFGNNDLAGVFEFKQWHRLVVAEGSIRLDPNPPEDKGRVYQIIDDSPIIPIPDWIVDKLPRKTKVAATPGEKVGIGGRHELLTQIAGKLRNSGLDADALTAALIPINESQCDPPVPEEDVKHIAGSVSRYPVPEPEPELIFGPPKPKVIEPVADWRTLFHTLEETDNSPGITFLIDGFLQCEGVTGIAAPVRERKSLIALNVALSLCTGEKLFGHFEVVKKPERVLYLCPEVSLGPFADRVKKIGLRDYVGKTFFYRTLTADGHLKLNDDSLQEALPGSVVFLDTAIRFLEGDENSSDDVRAFADRVFSLLRRGALSIVLLHHSPKESGDNMTLENAMRGSGDMGAFLAACWGTRLQDPAHPYDSKSYLTNLKQRDFESQDFEATCDRANGRMTKTSDVVVALNPRKGNVANKDGRDDAALALLQANPKLSARDSVALLKQHGIKRGKTWVLDRKYEMMQEDDESPDKT